ncbi:MAG: DUF4350 domain-containing protein [Muribaculaceae bacterium]|nr:DUF4350 domain-containing protein [Muribaculaceae bacterium]
MKVNGVFVAVIIVLMAVMILFEMNAPNRFHWDEYSQSYSSKQPFGCYVMDSVLRASVPQGYEVRGSDIEKCLDDSLKAGKHTFLFTNNIDQFINLEDIDFFGLIEEGNNVIIATDSYIYSDDDDTFNEKLEFNVESIDYYSYYDNFQLLSDSSCYDLINWLPNERFYAATFKVNRAFCHYQLNMTSSFRSLMTHNRGNEQYQGIYDYAVEDDKLTHTVAGIRDYGKGKIVVTSMPYLFTNYGILDDTMRQLVLRLLTVCGNLPIVRYDSTLISQETSEQESESESPLRYLLANRPLRWAFYLALATVVASVIFSARRRQRVIPVIKPPVNHMMDFVKRIGGIYYKRHNNVDLLIKKYVTFSNDLRAKAMIDIDNYDFLDDELMSLSNRTGIPFNELQQQIRDVVMATNAPKISDDRLKQLIDMMNNILQRINI